MTRPTDERLGIVRLPLPDGREVALCLTYERLDTRGHAWVIEKLEALQKGKAGSAKALAELLELFSQDTVSVDDVVSGVPGAYPIGPCTVAIWSAWELAYHGPGGRPEKVDTSVPRKRRPTLWSRRFGRRSERG